MKCKVLRNVGRTLLAEYARDGLTVDARVAEGLKEGCECDVPEALAERLLKRDLVEITEKPRPAPTPPPAKTSAKKDSDD